MEGRIEGRKGRLADACRGLGLLLRASSYCCLLWVCFDEMCLEGVDGFVGLCWKGVGYELVGSVTRVWERIRGGRYMISRDMGSAEWGFVL